MLGRELVCPPGGGWRCLETSLVAQSEDVWVAGVCRGQAKRPTVHRTTLSTCRRNEPPEMLSSAEVENHGLRGQGAVCSHLGPGPSILPEPLGTGGQREGVMADTRMVDCVDSAIRTGAAHPAQHAWETHIPLLPGSLCSWSSPLANPTRKPEVRRHPRPSASRGREQGSDEGENTRAQASARPPDTKIPQDSVTSLLLGCLSVRIPGCPPAPFTTVGSAWPTRVPHSLDDSPPPPSSPRPLSGASSRSCQRFLEGSARRSCKSQVYQPSK